MELLIKNGIIYTGNGFEKRDVLCNNCCITKISENISEVGRNYINAENLVLSPGFVDLHVHLREPGFPYKETIATGTAAALAGGFTTVCAMPNLNPTPDNIESFNVQQKIIDYCAKCKVLPFMAITQGREGIKVINLSELPKNCVGISDDGRGVQSKEVIEEAIKQAAAYDILISEHCEDDTLSAKGGCIHEGNYSKRHGLIGISSASEYSALQRDLELVKKYHCRYHACHISTKESVEMIRLAKMDGLPVSCEVTPHHILLCEDDILDDGCFKMAPPLRSVQDRQALLKGVLDGTIDAFATDHAPHSIEEKNGGLAKSAMGIVGLETAFAVLFHNLVRTKVMPFEKLLSLLTFGPCRIIRRPCGIKIGNKADITLINPYAVWRIDSSKFFSKGKSTPFDGSMVTGRVVATILDGTLVYKVEEDVFEE
jgi:dihydroorotase